MPQQSGYDGPSVPTDYDPAWDAPMPFSPWVFLHHPALLLTQPITLLFGGFWVWMLVHCLRNDPERNLWLWILLVGNVPGAFVYFIVRWLPGARVSNGPSIFSRWSRSRQIPRLEAAVRNIGNAHQFVELGDALRETGKIDRAADCYAKALQKDAASLPARWGAAQVAFQRKNLPEARGHLEQILAKDVTYKFGDVSLAQCRTLCLLNEKDAARTQLEMHLKRWTHPEAYVLLAELLIENGEHATAREHLESTISDLRGGPAFFARQNRGWARKAKRLLGRLPQ